MPRLSDGITPYEVTSNGKPVERFGARCCIKNRVTGQAFKGSRFGFKTRPEATAWRDYGLARLGELGQKQKQHKLEGLVGELTLRQVINIYGRSLHFRNNESSANGLEVLNALKERASSLVRKTLRQLNENAPNDFQDYFDQRLNSGISPGAVHREKLQHMCMLLRSAELRINPLLAGTELGDESRIFHKCDPFKGLQLPFEDNAREIKLRKPLKFAGKKRTTPIVPIAELLYQRAEADWRPSARLFPLEAGNIQPRWLNSVSGYNASWQMNSRRN
jgi:hypothetical protein